MATSRSAPAPAVPLLAADDPRRWWLLAACSLVAFAQLSEPHLWMIGYEIPASAFGVNWREYRFLSNVGLVLFVSFQLAGGVLGDIFGRRRLLLIGAIGATVANLLSALAWNLPSLIVARGLVGILGALAFPMALGIVRLAFTGDERKIALLIYTFSTALGTLASLLAIPFELWFGWRSTLALPIITGVVGVWLAWRYLPESKAAGGLGRVEGIVASAWTMVILALIFGLTVWRAFDDWRNPITTASLIAGLLGALILGYWTQRPNYTRLVRRTRHLPQGFLLIMLLITATLSFGLSGYILQLYQHFFTVQQLPGLLAGIALAPIFLGNLFTLRLVARFAIEQPRHVSVAGGLAAMSVGVLFSALARPNTPYLFLVPAMVLFGLGFLLASTAWTHFFFGAMPGDLTGVSAGINRAAAMIGGALAGIILSNVLKVSGLLNFSARLEDLGLAESQQDLALRSVDLLLVNRISADTLDQTPAALVALGLLGAYRESFSVGISTALVSTGVACLLCAALAWVWLRRSAAARVYEYGESQVV